MLLKPPVEAFCQQFLSLTTFRPFRWQTRLFQQFLDGDLPSGLDLPTGLGKTSVMPIWYLALKAGAPLPRRLVYVVDRRAVVDQATAEAEKVKARFPDLRISTLRGQYADRGSWLQDPAAPAIIVGTVDMIGSRLLFSGYGVSRKMRPYHAGLLGADSLIVLDESHLVPPFERLLEAISTDQDLQPRDREIDTVVPRLRLLALSATGRVRDGKVFRLAHEDEQDAVVTARLDARKRLFFMPAADKSLDEKLAEEAWKLSGEGTSCARVLIYCNSRDTAEKTKLALARLAKPTDLPPENFPLLVGGRRVRERERAKKRLESLGFFSGNDSPQAAAFVVATSAGEVGIDLDADHMVMDLVPFERVVQRLGRVNRLGGKEASVVVLEATDPNLPEDIRTRATRCLDLLQHLPGDIQYGLDASSASLGNLKREFPEETKSASSPEPLYPGLARPLVDAWSMTSLKEHSGRPEVAPWLRGWVPDEPQTTLVWRLSLPVRAKGGDTSSHEIEAFFEAAPPHLTEMLETRSDRIVKWLLDRAKRLGASRRKGRSPAAGAAEGAASEGPSLEIKQAVAIALGRSAEDARVLTLGYLINAADSSRERRNLERALSNRMLILDARMGGLSEEGLFDPKQEAAAATPDTDEEWEQAVGFRVRAIAPGAKQADAGWHSPFLFDLNRDDEGNPLRQLRIERYKGAMPTEDGRAVSPTRAQRLEQHQEWAASKAQNLANSLGLPGDIGDALVLAARLHDEGKKAKIWQRAFSAPGDAIYAKTKGPFRREVLGGYRHEFGSLEHVTRSNQFGCLSADLQDLVLHLVAAHHGRARPVIEADGNDAPPSVLEARARDVALRFARLQRRFGPWGLAWLEAILRAADQQASRDLDEGRTADG